MSLVVNTALPKLCHARVGQFVRLPDPQTGEVLDEVYMVAAVPEAKPRRGRATLPSTVPSSLSYEKREVFLVSIATGEALPMPHLSNRGAVDKAPVVPQAEMCLVRPNTAQWHRVTLQSGSDLRQCVELSLNDTTAVKELLRQLEGTGSSVVNVENLDSICLNEAKAFWRAAVAARKTELSFDEYMRNIHAVD